MLGYCGKIDTVMIGEKKVIRFSQCKLNRASTVVIRGSSQHLLDEAERSIHDALCVLTKTVEFKKTIYGGGNSELKMAIAIENLSKKFEGKLSLIIQEFASALKQLPMIIADNGGYDSSEIVQ